MTADIECRPRAPRTERHLVPGDGLLHPAAVLAIAVLLLNDHLLKHAWPGFVTGKLSDFAGLVFFPLVLQALCEVGSVLVGRPRLGNRPILVGAILATAAVFSAVQLVPAAADAYSAALGFAQSMFSAARVAGESGWRPHTVVVTRDPSDLIALPALLIAYTVGADRSGTPRPQLALVALVAAGLAALATSPPSYESVTGDGETLVESDAASVDVSVAFDVRERPDEQAEITVRLRGDPTERFRGGPLLASVMAAEGQTHTVHDGWPMDAPLAVDQCPATGRCSIPYRLELRPAEGIPRPVLVRWTVEARVGYPNGNLDLAVDDRSARALPIAGFALLGVVVALGATAASLSRAFRGSSPRALEAISASGVIGVGAVIGITGAAGVGVLIGLFGAAMLVAAAVPGTRGRRLGPVVVLLAFTCMLVSLVALVGSGMYRMEHVALMFIATGAASGIGLASALKDDRLIRFRARTKDLARALWAPAITVLVMLSIGVWAVAVAAGETPYAFWYAAVPALTVWLLGLALWRWFDGKATGLRALGVALPFLAGLSYLAASLRLPIIFFDGFQVPVMVTPTLLGVGFGGVVLAVVGRYPLVEAPAPSRPEWFGERPASAVRTMSGRTWLLRFGLALAASVFVVQIATYGSMGFAAGIGGVLGAVGMSTALTVLYVPLMFGVPAVATALVCWRLRPISKLRTILTIGTTFIVVELVYVVLLTSVGLISNPRLPFGESVLAVLAVPALTALLTPRPPPRLGLEPASEPAAPGE